MHQQIEPLHQELTACIQNIWSFSREARALQIRPGWVLAGKPEHGCYPLLQQSLERLQQRFSEETLTTMAADMYFNPLWWHEASGLIYPYSDYRYPNDHHALSMLEAWIVEHPPADIHLRLETRLKWMLQNPYDNTEISFHYSLSYPPNLYLLPNVDTCLELLAKLQPTPERLDLAKRILDGEFNYGPIEYSTDHKPEMSYQMYRLAGRFQDLFIYLCRNEVLTYEIYQKGMLLTQYIREGHSNADIRSIFLPANKACLEQMYRYTQRMIEEISQQLSEENFRFLLRPTGPQRGATFLLRAAENHIRLKSGKLTGRFQWPRTIENAIVRLASAMDIEPATEAERQALIGKLRQFPVQTLEWLLPVSPHGYRLLCAALDWEHVLPLVEHIIRIAHFSSSPVITNQLFEATDIPNSADTTSGIIDVQAVKSALESAGAQAAKVFDLFSKAQVGVDNTLLLIGAVAGWNREKVQKSFLKHSQIAIKAFGLLPLERGEEEVYERYLALKQSAKDGQKFGQMRRVSHAGAVRVALINLAQVAGYPDADRLEWAMEAKISQEVASPECVWKFNDYEMQVQVSGVDAAIVIRRDGRTLKTPPPAIRSTAEYKEAKKALAQFRVQVSRLRSGLLEGFLASGDTLPLEELARLLPLPAARDMMQRLVFRSEDGVTGMLRAETMTLRDLQGNDHSIQSEVSLVHPFDLYHSETLADWQREIVRQRIVQPIKQVFRELYLLTPAELTTRTYSNRFAGHVIDGTVAAKLFGTRGWQIERSETPLPFKIFQGMRAVFALPDANYFLGGGTPVTTDRIYFELHPNPNRNTRNREESWLPLDQIPPLIFSEVMRDADLIVSVAQRGGEARLSNETYEQRGSIVKALLDDLELSGVEVDGHFAYVQGKLARYRVHLGSAVIHIEPGNYLCIVPDRWGMKHDKLFLPFADEKDSKISEVISKILLLLADDKIKDESILRQIRR